MKKTNTQVLIGIVVLVVLGFVFFWQGGVKDAKQAGDSAEPIIIPTHNWSSQVVMAYVIGGIFEKNGNNVKYVPGRLSSCI